MIDPSRHTRSRGSPCRRWRCARPGSRALGAGGWRRLGLEPLEDRCLLSVGVGGPTELPLLGFQGAQIGLNGPAAEVRGRWLFYNNSSFDGNDPAADAADDAAIALDKQALLPGAGTATFANYTSYSRGINGVMIDVAGLAGAALDVSDFAFRCARSGDPAGWSAAPSPASIAVRPGAGTGGSDRITLIWDDGAIVNRHWLEITVLAGLRTGLAADDVFYFGSAIGETGNSASEARANSSDTTRIRNHFSSAAGVGLDDIYDLDRDGDVDADDVTVCRSHYSGFTPTALIAPPARARPPAAPATVVARRLFYNNSSFDGDDPAANAADDATIALDKQALLPGAGTATLANYTSYSRGINGVMVDVAGLVRATLDASDFVFRYGTGDDPIAWTAAPSPASVTVRSGAGTGGSDRITLVWPDNAVPNGRWLQVTLLAGARTGLEANDVFYFGSAIGETGNHPAEARVNSSDTTRIRNHFSRAGAAGIDSLYDLDRDGDVDAGDVTICRAHYSAFTPLLPITPPALSPSPAAPAAAGGWGIASEASGAPATPTGRVPDAEASPEGNGPGAGAAGDPLAQGGGSLGGTVFEDRDGNGSLDAGEPPTASVTVYLDSNENGSLDTGEAGQVTRIGPLDNNSKFDGYDPAANAADFAFAYGNDDNPAGWTTAPGPVTMAVRPGAGVGGSDRTTLIWADNAIPNGNWLQVTVKANANTGMVADDVFYFGCAIGETGNSTADAKVNSSDVTICRNDYSGFTPLKLITPPGGLPGPQRVPAAVDAVLSQDPAPWAREAHLDLVWMDAVARSRSKRSSFGPDALLQAVEQRLPL